MVAAAGLAARAGARAEDAVKRVGSGKKKCWEMSKAELLDPSVVVFDYEELLEYAEGDIAPVFGPAFAAIDAYPRRVRLPAREYLLVTRVTVMDAELGNFRAGARMVTEYDVPVNGELSEGGDVPWAVLVEAGQCDLMLISYMGIDLQCRGERVYRLLNTTLTFYGVAKEGETLVYDIRTTGFAKRPDGDISMFFFEYDCYCNGRLLIEMRDGCAGFFSNEELAAGKGVLMTRAEQLQRAKIARSPETPLAVAPALHKTSLGEREMQALVRRDWAGVFGAQMRGLDYKLCATKMLMIDRVTRVDHRGGAYGLGLLVGEKVLDPSHWYFPCHFVKDQVMAGSLVSDGCSQLLKTYMIWLGLHTTMPQGFDFRPVDGQSNKVRCRGQISPHRGKLVYVMEIKAMGYDAEGHPYAVADVDIIDVNTDLGQSFDMADLSSYGKGDLGKKIVVDFKGIGLSLRPRKVESGSAASSGGAAAAPVAPASAAAYPQPPAGCLASDPAPPGKVTWHPMAQLPGNPTPGFSPSAYPPRAIAFTPFPGNPLDNNHTPGEAPLNWFNMSEFMCGKVSNCLGPEFKRFDVSKTSRSPAFDLALVTRVVRWDGIEKGSFYNVDCNPGKGTMVGEFDCPPRTWFLQGSSNDKLMPYSIVMEIALQTSGVLTSVLKAPLTMDKDDILFRNLDAEAEMVDASVDPRGKVIKNDTKCTGYSMMGKMGIHRFTFELSVEGKVFYKGSTSFGWFTPEVFAQQVGLDGGKKSQPWHVENKDKAAGLVAYELGSPAGKAALFARAPAGHQLARRATQCEFLDRAWLLPSGGLHGQGYAHGQRTVVKTDWFFSCHFWFDPVMPGSLGIESMFQLIEAIAVHNDLAGKFGVRAPRFSHANGKTSWKYRGQLTPKNDVMDSEVHIKSVTKTADGAVEVVAQGFLWVDGLRVYAADNLRLRIEPGEQQQQRPATAAVADSVQPLAPQQAPQQAQQPLNVAELRKQLLQLDRPLHITAQADGQLRLQSAGGPDAVTVPRCDIADMGDRAFMECYGVVAPIYTGAMAKGIASADLVIAVGKRKLLGSFGAGGLPMHIVRAAIDKIQAALPHGPYAVNLIHSPFDSNLEKGNVDLFLEKGVHVVEASAFMDLTPQVVRYRAAGLQRTPSGGIRVTNHIIGKCSRTELAEMFVRPAPKAILDKLVAAGDISAEQATMALQVPMADDIAVEADSGGHTDNRPIHVLLPLIIALRNRLHKELGYPAHLRVRVGAGGGIGCPEAALATLSMGAAFILTGTVNQVARQSGTCDNVRLQLSQASYSDVAMAAAADMFEQGVKLQVLKKGSMFASRANKLYDLFCKYDSFEAFPEQELKNLETRIFKKSIAEVWAETKDFYINRLHNPDKIERAEKDAKLKMSLCMRWYLGLSSFWANTGVVDRTMDYQIWCGPAIGSYNEFVKGSYLDPKVANEYPSVEQINLHILRGAAYLRRLQVLRNDPRMQAFDAEDPALSYTADVKL